MKTPTWITSTLVFQVLWPIVVILLFVLSGSGCSPAEPQGAVELNAGPAMDLIMESFHSDVAHPGVFGVASDCSDVHDGGQGFGFWLDGACRGGFTSDQRVYIVLHPAGTRYSYNAAHEARHWAAGGARVGGDLDPDHRAPGFYDDVARARAALVASDLDVVQVGAVGFERGPR